MVSGCSKVLSHRSTTQPTANGTICKTCTQINPDCLVDEVFRTTTCQSYRPARVIPVPKVRSYLVYYLDVLTVDKFTLKTLDSKGFPAYPLTLTGFEVRGPVFVVFLKKLLHSFNVPSRHNMLVKKQYTKHVSRPTLTVSLMRILEQQPVSHSIQHM